MKRYENFEVFVFDWDGTINDTVSSIVEAYQYACKAMGYSEPSADLVRSTIGLSMERGLRICCPDCPPEKMEEYFRHYASYYIPHEAQVQLVTGMEELLREMKAAGLRLAVATGKSQHGMKRVLTKYGLTDIFESVQTADMNFSKPHPQMLESISDETGVECSKMLMIGDSALDLQMAKNAEASAIGVTYGSSDASTLAAVEHLKLCKDVQELREFLEF